MTSSWSLRGAGGVDGVGLVPVWLVGLELLPLVIEAQQTGGGHGIDGALGGADGAGEVLLDEIALGDEFGIAAEQNVGAAAGHVGGDGDLAELSGLGDDLGLALVEFGVEHDVLDAFALEDVREQFGLFDRGGADEDGLIDFVEFFDLVGDGEVFFFYGAEDDVGVLDAAHRLVGGDDDDVELVDLVELGGLGLGGSGHAGELFVEAEVVLEGDGGEGLVFLADADALFCLDCLVESVGPAAAGHEASGELSTMMTLAVFDDILHIALVEGVGLDRGLDVVLEVPVFDIGDVADAEQLLDLFPAVVGDGDGFVLFVDDVVFGEDLGFALLDLFAENEFGNDLVDADILVGGLVGGAADDERGAGLVDEDRVDFVDDGEVVAALDTVLDVELHVVAQVVEAELVVGAVGDVGGVGLAALVVVEVVDDDADSEAEELVDFAHPLGVALGEVVVDGDDVDSVAGEGIEVAGEGRDEGFALTGAHFSDLALVEDHAADQLDVEMAHVDDALAGLADEGEGLGEDFVERGLFGGDDLFFVSQAFELGLDAGFEILGFGAKLFIGELLQLRLEGADGLDAREQALHGAIIAGAEDLCECFLDHVGTSLGCIRGRVCLRVAEQAKRCLL